MTRRTARYLAGLAAVALSAMVSGCHVSPAGEAVGGDDWRAYQGAVEGGNYSPLDQINAGNVKNLAVAWRLDFEPGGLQTQPLVIGGVLYAYTPKQQVIAVDAATGKVKWTFDPGIESAQPARGLVYWTDGSEARLFASNDNFLLALDPATGSVVPGFGKEGRVDLREGLGGDPTSFAAYGTTPGVLFDNMLIMGFRTGETRPSAPGAIRAFDVKTGRVRWTFNLIPHRGEFGADTWPAQSEHPQGSANSWPGLALDRERGIVYVPTGSPSPDFYGGDRKGDNLFSNSLVALDARTGKRKWHFQAVHHDLWDRDFPSPPVLVQVRAGGRMVDAVVQTSKHGFVFLFDRSTGKPLFPVEERPVPASAVPGEYSAPTQPFVIAQAPFARQLLTADLLTTRTPAARADVLKRFQGFCNGPQFTPLCVDKQTVVFPGFDGGAEWGGSAIDRERAILYFNSNDIPWTGALTQTHETANVGRNLFQAQCAACHGVNKEGSPPEFPDLRKVGTRLGSDDIAQILMRGRGRMPGFPFLSEQDRKALIAELLGSAADSAGTKREVEGPAGAKASTRYTFTGYKRFQDPDGYPASKPPWGTLNALDLNTGKYLWQIPLGEYPALAAIGMRNTGSENYGGPILLKTGLLFIGATVFDRKFRAFDAATGRAVWEYALPYAGNATPITYRVNGRQFIVIATSGKRDPAGPQGAAYVAFALPASATLPRAP